MKATFDDGRGGCSGLCLGVEAVVDDGGRGWVCSPVQVMGRLWLMAEAMADSGGHDRW